MAREISGIQFNVLTSSEIREISVCAITSPETLRSDGVPVKNGLLDPRMGVDSHGVCSTCGHGTLECNGHYGHIELPADYPLYNMLFRSYILKVVNTVCSCCANLVLPGTAVDRAVRGLSGVHRLTALHKASAMLKECTVCATPYAAFSWQGSHSELPRLVRAASGDEPARMEPSRAVYALLNRIDQDTADLLGFACCTHPRVLMNTCIVVLPKCARPGVVIEDYRAEDDLTVKLADVLKTILCLTDANSSGAPTHVVEEIFMQLQSQWSTFQKNDTGASVTEGGRTTVSVCDRYAGKAGRMRNNVQGKRVNCSVRTVISCDQNLLINEVSIPRSVASTLTVLEPVNDRNCAQLQDLVDLNRANTLIRDGRVFDLNIKRSIGQAIVLAARPWRQG